MTWRSRGPFFAGYLHPALTWASALKARRALQLEERVWAGSRWREGDFVITRAVGTPMIAGDVTTRFQRLLRAADLPRMRFHDLRHGAASLLLSQGVHPRVAMRLLGHSTIGLTMNTYSHVIRLSATLPITWSQHLGGQRAAPIA